MYWFRLYFEFGVFEPIHTKFLAQPFGNNYSKF